MRHLVSFVPLQRNIKQTRKIMQSKSDSIKMLRLDSTLKLPVIAVLAGLKPPISLLEDKYVIPN